MAEFERLVSVYRMRATSAARSRLDVLLDLERIRDPGVVPFLIEVLTNRRESTVVRMYVVKRLRSRDCFPTSADRPSIATALCSVLADDANQDLRLQAALALADYCDADGVLARLFTLALAVEQSVDLRYTAFASIERAGPMPESIMLMCQLANDETLGDAARRVLSAWNVDQA
jgi:hypothetical protein